MNVIKSCSWLVILGFVGSVGIVSASYIIPNGSVTTAKIASNAVTTAKIANNAVTTSQIASAAVTNSQLASASVATANIQSQAITQGLLAARATGSTVAAGGVALSAGSGAYSNGSTSFVSVTNLSVTITTTGRPVFVGLVNDVSSDSWIGFTNTGSVNVEDLIQVSIQFLRGASSLGVSRISSNQNNGSGTGSSIFEIPPSSIHLVDFPTAGTYTYTVQEKVNDGSALFNSVKLLAYEL